MIATRSRLIRRSLKRPMLGHFLRGSGRELFSPGIFALPPGGPGGPPDITPVPGRPFTCASATCKLCPRYAWEIIRVPLLLFLLFVARGFLFSDLNSLLAALSSSRGIRQRGLQLAGLSPPGITCRPLRPTPVGRGGPTGPGPSVRRWGISGVPPLVRNPRGRHTTRPPKARPIRCRAPPPPKRTGKPYGWGRRWGRPLPLPATSRLAAATAAAKATHA